MLRWIVSFVISFWTCSAAIASSSFFELYRMHGSFDKIKVNQQVKSQLQQRLQNLKTITPSFGEHFDLTMKGVPVYEQGQHGTCATFAITAAINAQYFNGKDEVSQLCLLNLQKGFYQTSPSYTPGNAWEGVMASDTIRVIQNNGVMKKSHEASGICGGITSYPVDSDNTGGITTIYDYVSRAKRLYHFDFTKLLSSKRAFSNTTDTEKVLQDIKQALKSGKHVVLGVAVASNFNSGFETSYQAAFDTWAVTPQLQSTIQNNSLQSLAFHEVVLYGFDDDITITASKGSKKIINQGAFYLRNSFGESFGNEGDGFVTYDYLRLMIVEAYSLHKY